MPTIRRADMKDLEEVINLRLAFLREVKPDAGELEPAVLDSTRQYIAEKLPAGDFLVWLVEEQQQIIGTSGLVFFHRPPTFSCMSELHAYVLNMYTIPERRGQGVATMLLQHIIDYVKTTPASRITLHASEMGRPIYERLGFVASSSEMILRL